MADITRKRVEVTISATLAAEAKSTAARYDVTLSEFTQWAFEVALNHVARLLNDEQDRWLAKHPETQKSWNLPRARTCVSQKIKHDFMVGTE